MSSGSLSASSVLFVSGLLLVGSATLAQANPFDTDRVSGPTKLVEQQPDDPFGAVEQRRQRESERNRLTRPEKVARDLAFRYLSLWSAPNQVTLASASSFYGPTVTFHGRTRSLASVLAEKRRFAERWPDRNYRHLPQTTQVACEAGGARCTVRSSFDFSAANSREDRHSEGIGEHELVVSLAGERPVIASENSRVVLRGRGNMSWLLEDGL